jgi:hypothetical protein
VRSAALHGRCAGGLLALLHSGCTAGAVGLLMASFPAQAAASALTCGRSCIILFHFVRCLATLHGAQLRCMVCVLVASLRCCTEDVLLVLRASRRPVSMHRQLQVRSHAADPAFLCQFVRCLATLHRAQLRCMVCVLVASLRCCMCHLPAMSAADNCMSWKITAVRRVQVLCMLQLWG